MKTPASNNIAVVEPKPGPKLPRRIFVRDLVLAAQIGIHMHERGARQPVRVNLELMVAAGGDIDGSAGSDRLSHAVCYQKAVEKVREVAEGGHINLVETLAERIARALLEDERVCEVRVVVEKTTALAGAASVGVDITRSRTSYV
jgi:dihydroneopterin aldolase